MAAMQESAETLTADWQLKSQVMAQMDQGIALFEEQAADEVALRKFKNREAILLSNLIITGESLSVKLDQ